MYRVCEYLGELLVIHECLACCRFGLHIMSTWLFAATHSTVQLAACACWLPLVQALLKPVAVGSGHIDAQQYKQTCAYVYERALFASLQLWSNHCPKSSHTRLQSECNHHRHREHRPCDHIQLCFLQQQRPCWSCHICQVWRCEDYGVLVLGQYGPSGRGGVCCSGCNGNDGDSDL